jgi:hypothetical protein
MNPDSVIKDSLTTESRGEVFEYHRRATDKLKADVAASGLTNLL